MKVSENKSSVIKKILSVITAVAVTAAVFFAGFYTRGRSGQLKSIIITISTQRLARGFRLKKSPQGLTDIRAFTPRRSTRRS